MSGNQTISSELARMLSLIFFIFFVLSATVMTLHLLHDLPQEIRDKIYRYVLVSRTKRVALTHVGGSDKLRYCLQPFDFQENETAYDEFIGLQLLRTCKQIQDECKDLFWRLNTYSVALPWNCVEDLPCYSSIRRVEMGIHYLRGFEGGEMHQRQTRRALRTMATWSRKGRMQNITLNASRDGFPEEFDRIMCMGRLSGVNPEAQTLYNSVPDQVAPVELAAEKDVDQSARCEGRLQLLDLYALDLFGRRPLCLGWRSVCR
ncbi:hypothetical protein PVAG01_03584 [Phlyctema vagabunda]|uniref:Uncharacterized protein n=1 Tax=Phlyctema vagabunda TaxID=108571 RepID=A0ABR4PLW4_9HELO